MVNRFLRDPSAFIGLCCLLMAQLIATPALAQDCDPLVISSPVSLLETRGLPTTYDWQGPHQEIRVCYPSRQSNAQLSGFLVAPADLDQRRGPLPVVVIGPGSGGSARAINYLWSARELAGAGYLVLVGDPQGVGYSEVLGDPEYCGVEGCPGVPFQQTFNFVDGLESATDFVFSRGHPWLEKADLTRVGLAGHSLSARAASYLGSVDERIQAVVAWDNLTSDLYGDAGISSGGGTCGSLIGGELPNSLLVTPRVPSMGQASDAAGGCTPTNTDPEIKKTAFLVWRQHGVASMQVVFNGSAHGDWAQTSSAISEQLRLFQYYTRAWFDIYLGVDPSARVKLLVPKVFGQTADQQFSSAYRSALFQPESQLDCDDLAAKACAPGSGVAPSAPTVTIPAGSGRFGAAWSASPLLLILLSVTLWRLRCRTAL